MNNHFYIGRFMNTEAEEALLKIKKQQMNIFVT